MLKVLRVCRELVRRSLRPSNHDVVRREADRSARVETLEDRRVLSVTPPTHYVTQLTLVITGGEDADTVIVSQLPSGDLQVEQTVLGQDLVTNYPKALVTTLQFFGNGGDDWFENHTDIGAYAQGGAGDDVLIGGVGNDTLLGGSGNDRLEGRGGGDRLKGAGGSDTLDGGDGVDYLYGEADGDTLRGGEGDDFLYGADGDDELDGQGGNDYLEGAEGNDRLFGGQGDDKLLGGQGDDHLQGQEGDDWIVGSVGADSLYGDGGVDYLNGGEGDDILFGGDDADTILGEDGQDQLYGEGGGDHLEGNDGADLLYGGSGNDKLLGGLGDDQLRGQDGDDTLIGGLGKDLLLGDGGADRLEGGDDDELYGGDDADTLFGEGGQDVLYGENGDDYLEGNDDNDRLYGGNGNDKLLGGLGDDRLQGQAGADRLIGGAGNDLLLGDDGADNLEGGDGDDTLIGGDDSDTLYGQGGRDILYGENGDDYLEGNEDNDRLYGGSGNDKLLGGLGDDRLQGQPGADRLLGGDGADLLLGDKGADILEGGEGDDLLYGGDDDDAIFGQGGNDQLFGERGDDHLEGNEGDDRLYGGSGDDKLFGGVGDDRLQGHDGEDRLKGGDGADLIFGDAGIDRLEGEAGNDLLYGGDDDDTVFGGSGNDLLSGEGGNDYLEGNEDNDSLFGGLGSDKLIGGDGDDRLQGHDGGDRLIAGAGADILIGDGGDDILEGDAGDDTILGGDGDDIAYGDIGADRIEGGDGVDLIYGGDGDDELLGDGGADLIYGNAGNDTIWGGAGADNLHGDAGSDVVMGDDGDDLIYGEEDADALVGGAGADQVFGSDGADLLIGGWDVDQLFGNAGDDLLTGGRTIYDADPETLRLALAIWDSALAYEGRVDLLSQTDGPVSFVPHHTVHADLVSDEVSGGGGDDWFVMSETNGVYNPLGVTLHSGMGSMSDHHGATLLLDTPPAIEGFALIDSIDRVLDAQGGEVVDSMLPHHGDVSKLTEHLSVFQLVRYADVTHMAVASGDWSDPSIWENGVVPGNGARVLIPIGAHVTVDGSIGADIETVRVDGTIRFATDADSELRVDTMVVTATGSFQMGTAENPIADGVTARLLITDNGPIDRNADPFALGRGLITHGSVEMYGAETTSFVAAANTLTAGTSTIRLVSVPVGWSVGDEIVIAGTAVGGGQDEVRRITAISGDRVTVQPLTYDHVALEAGLPVHIANLTRNAVIESESNVDSRLGHVMFMHNREVEISYAAFNELGRTDKSVRINDSVVDGDWNLVEGTGTNQRARYSVHFHRNGVQANSAPSTVHGSVVKGGPGWGYVNHSSYVDFTENVAYGVDGAAYVAEAGDEIGSFDGNIALHTTGVDDDPDSRVFYQDFGFNGDGFWMQGPGVSVTNNVVSGSTGSAYMYYTRGLKFGGYTIPYLAENLDDPSLAGGESTIAVDLAPIKRFEGNVGYASHTGLTLRYHLRDTPHAAQSLLSDSTFWNNGLGVDLLYTESIVLSGLEVLVDPAADAPTGIGNNSQTLNINYNNLRVEGYMWGLILPRKGSNVVSGGHYANKEWNIVVHPADVAGLEISILREPTFGSATGKPIPSIAMAYTTHNAAENPLHVFNSLKVYIRFGDYTNHNLYFYKQAANSVPFPEPLPKVPSEYVGLTQAELYDRFGLAVGGEIAPSDATTADDIYGLVASVWRPTTRTRTGSVAPRSA